MKRKLLLHFRITLDEETGHLDSRLRQEIDRRWPWLAAPGIWLVSTLTIEHGDAPFSLQIDGWPTVQASIRKFLLWKIRSWTPMGYVVMVTKAGYVRRTPEDYFKLPEEMTTEDLAAGLPEDSTDTVVAVLATPGDQDILLMSNMGRYVRFYEEDVRPMGMKAKGECCWREMEDGEHVVTATAIEVE